MRRPIITLMALFCLVMTLCLASLQASGVGVGDKPELSGRGMKNDSVNLKDFSGKVVAEANGVLDKVAASIHDNDFTAAMKTLGKVPAGAAKDRKFAERLADVQKQLGTFADSMLAEVDPLLQSKQYPAAIRKLRDL